MEFEKASLFRLPGVNGSVGRNDLIGISKPEDQFNKSGTIRLNGHNYVLGINQTIDDVPIQLPILYQRIGVLYYEESGQKLLLSGSLMEKALISSKDKYKQSKEEKSVKVNEITKKASQILGNKVIDVEYITKVKYKDPQTVLQTNGQLITLTSIVIICYYLLNK